MQSLTEYTLSPMEWHRQARAWYQEMLSSHPIYFDEKSKAWWVFRHEDVEHVLKDYEIFSSARPLNGNEEGNSILTMDPPKHRQMRALVSQAFTPRAIQAMAPRIEQLTNELLDRVSAAGRMDVMEDLAHPLPVLVISEMLGLPKEDWLQLKGWSDMLLGDFAQEVGEDGMASTAWVSEEDMGAMQQYFARALEERRRAPRNDLITRLLQAEVDGVRLNQQELFSFCITLLVAGNVTTTNLIGNSILCFTHFPEAMAEVRNNPALLPQAIEEVLRYLPPLRKPGESDSVIIGRTVTTDVEIAGQLLHKGDTVMVGLASANFDPRQFPDPERFDIRRNPNNHLSFGHGVHFCIGAPLSRLETRIALTALLRRFSDIQIVPGAEIEQVRSGVVFGVKNLPIMFTVIA